MPQAVIDHQATDVYDAPNVKLARLEHDFIDGFAQMFQCPRALLRTTAKEELIACLRKYYPDLKRSKMRMFMEGLLTEQESNSLQICHRRNRDMVLLFCDLVETMYVDQEAKRVRESRCIREDRLLGKKEASQMRTDNTAKAREASIAARAKIKAAKEAEAEEAAAIDNKPVANEE